MSRKTRLLQDEDLAAVAAFLRRSFGEDTAVAGADSLRWKYLSPGPMWDGPRAFVVEQDGEVIAHSGLIPAVFLSPDKQPITSLVATDWAADPKVPGVGVGVYAHVIRRAETAFLIGGVEVTRAIVPKLGFRPFTEAAIYARWIRPWREFWNREKSVRSLQRLGHGVVHQLRDGPLKPGNWTATVASRFDTQIEPTIAFRPSRRTTFQRSVASLNHMLGCPTTRMQGYLLRDGPRVRGYVILAYLGWEARLIDINIDSERTDDWVAAYGAASSAARQDPNVCRIRAMTAVPEQEQALLSNGFWVNQREPFWLFDPKARAPDLPLDLQFFESDLGYV